MTSRRGFISGVGAFVAAPALTWAAVGNPVAVSGARRGDGTDVLVGIAEDGALRFELPLPARAHAGAAHPTRAEAVVIARRPGRFARVIDCASGSVLQKLDAPEGHHFYGHAAFSADGATLYTTENHIASGEGRIGVWDARLGYQRIDTFPSAGIGPHEILRLPNGDLAVANGGIRTHPDTGREKLNLDTMQPNLAILSPTGVLKDSAVPPAHQHQNSLRHIAVAADGTIMCGFQWQGDPFEAPSLVAFYKQGRMTAAEMDAVTLRGLDGYIGSVAVLGSTGFAASAPRGGRVILFDAHGAQSAVFRATDVCGLTGGAERVGLASDGTGRVYAMSNSALNPIESHDMAFDNHLVPV